MPAAEHLPSEQLRRWLEVAVGLFSRRGVDTGCIRHLNDFWQHRRRPKRPVRGYFVIGSAMKRRRHPSVIRAWLAGKFQKQLWKARSLMGLPRKHQPHNKT